MRELRWIFLILAIWGIAFSASQLAIGNGGIVTIFIIPAASGILLSKYDSLVGR